jgi:branched-chain amino acid transport system permease protein
MTDVLQHVVDALSLGSLYALLALGIALIFGIMRLLNFAHGELITVMGYGLWLLRDLPFVLQVLGALLITVVVGLVVERVAFRPLRGADGAVLLVSSFAVSFLLQSVLLVAFGARAKGVELPAFLSDNVEIGDLRVPVLSIVTVATTAVLLTLLGLFMGRTPLGIRMRAAAESFSTARLVGVRANTVITAAFVMSAVLAGVAGLLLVAQGGTVTPGMGTAPVLIAFVATIIGGLGSLRGAVIGGYMLGVLTVVLQVVLPLSLRPYRDAFVYGIVLLVLFLRPQGVVVLRSTLQRA